MPVAPRLTKSRLNNLAKLNTYTAETATARALQSRVKELYKTSIIRTFKQANKLFGYIENNEINKFEKLLKKIEDKKRAVQVVEVDEPDTVTVKNNRSELPTIIVNFSRPKLTVEDAWNRGEPQLLNKLETRLTERTNLKVVIGMQITVSRPSPDGKEFKQAFPKTRPIPIYSIEHAKQVLKDYKQVLADAVLETIEFLAGSDWVLEEVNSMFMIMYSQKAARGSSYIPTPIKFKNSKCGLINIQNDDNQCFKYCLLYHQSKQVKHDDRVSVLKKIQDKYDWRGITFPVSFSDIQKFEDLNKVCINVYGITKDQVHPLYLGNVSYCKNDYINLLLITDKDTGHYIYIKKLEHLLHSITHSQYKGCRYCPYCKKNLTVDTVFEEHLLDKHFNCNNNCNIELPAEGAVMKFKNYKNMLQRPYIVYADFECSIIPNDDPEKIAKHMPNSAMFYFVCTYDNSKNKLYKFDGPNCVVDMLRKLRSIGFNCILEMQLNAEMKLTDEDQNNFNNATKCYLCNECFTEKNSKVRDHCHRTGKFRGACHNKCNINYYSNRYLPVVFHNLRGYDGHIILKSAYDIIGNKKDQISAIPQSGEKFMSFKIGNLKFIDSFQFLTSSLEKLTDSLKSVDGDIYKNFVNMKKFFKDEDLNIICKKGLYPYEFIDSLEKIHYPKLPEQKDFYSKLKLEGITTEEYNHAENVYKHFKCKSFYDYHMLYLKTDVLLLADVFENFRNMCLEFYNLDPANYLTSASLAWDCMLLKTKVNLELITDVEILDFFERSKRGGLTFVGSKRYSKANNKEMGCLYDPNQESSYITYLDANSLYPSAMVQPLPHSDIKFVDDITLEKILNTPDDSEIGYMVECDIEFPEELHDKFRQFPPAPESCRPKQEWMTPFQTELMNKVNAKLNSNKLVPHLFKHNDYVLHYRNFKYIIELGAIVTLKRVVSFKQSCWMKPFIEFNNNHRTIAKTEKNEFKVGLFKLLSNSVFGKTMENVRNRIDMKLTVDRTLAVRWFSKLEFNHSTYIDGLYLIHMNRTNVILDKPIYVGCSILDISKLHMLKFHYGVISKHFKDKYDLIYSDTDSLIYNIKHENLHAWMYNNSDDFDMSSMTKYKKMDNYNILGKFKSEVGDKIITEFCGLNPKSYAYNYLENDKIKTGKRAKGISTSVVDKQIEFKDYKEVCETSTTQTRQIYNIKSVNQQLFTMFEKKVALNCFYDKMAMANEIDCIPYGYKNLNVIST